MGVAGVRAGDDMRRLVLALASLLISSPLFAQALPSVDIGRNCLKKAKTNSPTDDFYVTCVDAETVTLAELREDWRGYSSASRQRCLNTAGNGSFYSDLQACIEAAEALRSTEGK